MYLNYASMVVQFVKSGCGNYKRLRSKTGSHVFGMECAQQNARVKLSHGTAGKIVTKLSAGP